LRRLCGTPHEPDFRALRYFPPDQLFLDIGANYGQSISSMRLMSRQASIIAYEPNGELAVKIAHLFRYDQRVTVLPFGLSSAPGTFDLFMPFYRTFAYPGLASLNEEEARSWLSADNIYFFNSRNVRIARMRCQVETLDAQDLTPYFIKIDVQGAELDVLRGAQTTLTRHRPVLLVENPGRDLRIAALLNPLGYREYEFSNGHFVQRKSLGINSFFMTADREAELTARYPGLFVQLQR
jgi:FkbM family methyltransferase